MPPPQGCSGKRGVPDKPPDARIDVGAACTPPGDVAAGGQFAGRAKPRGGVETPPYRMRERGCNTGRSRQDKIARAAYRLGRAPRLGTSGGFFWFFACGAMPRNRAHRNKRDAKPTRSVGSDSTGPGTGAMNRARHRREFEADPCGPQCIQNKEPNPGGCKENPEHCRQSKTARRGQDPALQDAETWMPYRAFA